MNGLDGLIRLHKWRLDEKRQVLAELERLAARLREQLATLERELATEQRVAASSMEAAAAYGQYAAAVISRRTTINRSLADVEGQIRQALEEVAEAFRELKKYDLAKARRERDAAEKAKRQEQAQLNELGLVLHRRNEADA
jgi:flagellar export protein FliJ